MKRGLRKAMLGIGLGLAVTAAAAETEVGRHYDSVFAAVEGFFEAVKGSDDEALLAILGPDAESLLHSGDPVDDANDRQRFAERLEQKIALVRAGPDQVTLAVGEDEWPFPIPLVSDEQGWFFDTAQGKEELLNRRIGGNELDTLNVVRAYVDAQYEYAQRDPAGTGSHAYARHFHSAEGQKDGLYWPAAEGEEESPMGPLAAQAAAEGYTDLKNAPYHGYRFRILTAQGKSAPGGERSYLLDGRLAGGFALIAYPAQYGASGIMTFQVNQQGIVFQKDLGPDTEQLAASIQAYDPDETWIPTGDRLQQP